MIRTRGVPRLTCENGRIEVLRTPATADTVPGRGDHLTRGALVAQRTCSVDGCDRIHYSQGYCSAHYQRWRKSGESGPVEVMRMVFAKGPRSCSVEGCDRPYLARDYCSLHWQRWKRTGDPGPAETIRRHYSRCQVDSCDRPHYGQGYCGLHLRRWKRNGDPGPAEVTYRPETCTVDGCDDVHSARGYCASHYARWNRTGSAGRAFSVRRRNPAIRDEHGRKQCRTCDQWLPEESFSKCSPATDGKAPHCKDCHYAAFIARRYGVEPGWYAHTLERQHGGCAVCGSLPNERKLHVDHDHSHCAADRGCSKCVRGLLCGKCNAGMGMFNEDAARLRAAISYLESDFP